MLQHFRMFAAYNEWANRLLYAAAAELDPEELHTDRGAFFGSLFGTLSHIVVADRVWLKRFTGEGPVHRSLDERPFNDLDSLTAARRTEDNRIISWLDGINAEALSKDFTYVPITNPEQVTQKLSPALAHFFNHQTHHRGQAHMTLTALGKPSLALDLIYFQRSEGMRFL